MTPSARSRRVAPAFPADNSSSASLPFQRGGRIALRSHGFRGRIVGDGLPGGGSRRPKPILRARFIPDRLVVEIADIVRHWPELPLSWELIRQQFVHDLLNREARRTKHLPEAWSRQALSKNATIKKAYKERKDELTKAQARDATRPKRRRDPVVVVLKQENETLKIKIKQLEDTVRSMRTDTAPCSPTAGAARSIRSSRSRKDRPETEGRMTERSGAQIGADNAASFKAYLDRLSAAGETIPLGPASPILAPWRSHAGMTAKSSTRTPL